MNGMNLNLVAPTYVGTNNPNQASNVAYRAGNVENSMKLAILHLENNGRDDFGVLNVRGNEDGTFTTNFVTPTQLFPEHMLEGKSQAEIMNMTRTLAHGNPNLYIYRDES
jgi:hypothetical protein